MLLTKKINSFKYLILLILIFINSGCYKNNLIQFNIPSNSYNIYNSELGIDINACTYKQYLKRKNKKDILYNNGYMEFNKTNYIYPNALNIYIDLQIQNKKNKIYNVWKIEESFINRKKYYKRNKIYHGNSSKRFNIKCPREVERCKIRFEIRDHEGYLYFIIGDLNYVIQKKEESIV